MIQVKTHKRNGRIVRSHMRKTQKSIAQKKLRDEYGTKGKPGMEGLRKAVKYSDEEMASKRARKRGYKPMAANKKSKGASFRKSHNSDGYKDGNGVYSSKKK